MINYVGNMYIMTTAEKRYSLPVNKAAEVKMLVMSSPVLKFYNQCLPLLLRIQINRRLKTNGTPLPLLKDPSQTQQINYSAFKGGGGGGHYQISLDVSISRNMFMEAQFVLWTIIYPKSIINKPVTNCPLLISHY